MDVIALGCDLSAGLAALHAGGAVCGSLRPQRVFVTAERVAKLADVAASEPGESRELDLDAGANVLAYLAPEQLHGGGATERGDLFALGVVLYEALTGQRPFRGTTASALMSQHRSAQPLPPSRVAPACPEELERLVLSMLDRVPEARPAAAASVHATLRSLARSRGGEVMHAPAPLTQIARNTFVGRRAELAAFRLALDNAYQGRGAVLLVEGPAGAGKSRLADEMAVLARLRQAVTLVGRGSEVEGAPAYWPWMEVADGLAHSFDLTALARAAGADLRWIERVFPQLAPNATPGASGEPTDPGRARFRLFESTIAMLAASAAQRPLVILLDDMHRADESSLALLEQVARRIGTMRLTLVATFREPAEDDEAFRTTLARLTALPTVERLTLTPFSREDVHNFLVGATGMQPDPELVSRLLDQTDGNPFFLAEVVNLLATREGTLNVTGTVPLPDSLRAVLMERVRPVSAATRRLLQLAAVEGREFHAATLEDATGLPTAAELQEAIDARLAEDLGAGRYRFVHALTQGVLLTMLPVAEAQHLHGLVANAIERTQDATRPEVVTQLAEHLSQAARGDAQFRERAFAYLKEAARRAEAAFAWPAAMRYYDRWLELAEGMAHAGEAATLEARALASRLAGVDQRDAWRTLMRAIDAYLAGGDAVGGARTTLAALAMPASPERRRQLADAMLEHASGPPARLEGLLVAQRLRLGSLPPAAAEALDSRLTALRGAAADPELEAQAASLALDEAIRTRRLDDAIGLARAAAERHEAQEDMFAAAAALHTGYLAVSLLGRLDEGERALQEIAALTGRTRNFLRGGYAQMGLAGVYRTRGAWPQFNEAVARIPDQNWTKQLYIAEVAELAGDVERAATLLPDAALTGGQPGFDLIMRGARARILYHAGMTEAAAAELAAWQGVLDGVLAAEGSTILELTPETVAYPFPVESAIALADECLVGLGSDAQAAQARRLLDAAPMVRAAAEFRGVDVIRGALAQRAHDLAAAERHYAAGLAWAEREHGTVMAGRCLQGLAEVALARGEPAAAVGLLDRALGCFSEAGAGLYLRRALALRLDAGAPEGLATSRRMGFLTASQQAATAASAAPQGTVTIMFTDIEASTRQTEEVGDRRWLALLRQHNAIVRTAVAAQRGFEVKTVGDAFMLAFRSAGDALQCAAELQRELAASGLPIHVRIGIHTGEPAQLGTDYYGHHINLAARITATAAAGEVLVSSVVRSLVDASGVFEFTPCAPVQFDGIAGTHQLYRLTWVRSTTGE